MLSKYKQKRDQGFTIIEVLIVLAIAGLIMLVVFLAIPALQRNSRNTQRTNDVANILGAVGEFVSNNNGKLPTAVSADTENANTLIVGATSDNEVEVNLGYFTAANIGLNSTAELTTDRVNIRTGAKCDGTSVTTTGASARNYVAAYILENNATQCRES